MMERLTEKHLVFISIAWKVFLIFAVIPVMYWGSQMTGMGAWQQIHIFNSYLFKPLGYFYYALNTIIPDSSLMIIHLAGILSPGLKLYFAALIALFISPPFWDRLKEKVETGI